MAVGAAGGVNTQALANLQRQLQADQRQLALDLKAKSGQQAISTDQAKIVLDQTQIAAAEQSSTSAVTIPPASAQASDTAGSQQGSTSIDMYL